MTSLKMLVFYLPSPLIYELCKGRGPSVVFSVAFPELSTEQALVEVLVHVY